MSIRLEVGLDCQDPEALAPFWAEALGYEIGKLSPDGVYLVLEPPDMEKPVFYLQRVPEGKSVKNRMHLDLWTTTPELEIERLASLGAERSGEPMFSPGGSWWQVMRDPEGNEFCVCRERAPEV